LLTRHCGIVRVLGAGIALAFVEAHLPTSPKGFLGVKQYIYVFLGAHVPKLGESGGLSADDANTSSLKLLLGIKTALTTAARLPKWNSTNGQCTKIFEDGDVRVVRFVMLRKALAAVLGNEVAQYYFENPVIVKCPNCGKRQVMVSVPCQCECQCEC
jgi:hypothetical protein